MKMEHYLTAYDSKTDALLSFLFSVPDSLLWQVKEIAKVDSKSDPEAIGSYQLSKSQAQAIAKLLNRRLELEQEAVFFLEPVASE